MLELKLDLELDLVFHAGCAKATDVGEHEVEVKLEFDVVCAGSKICMAGTGG